MQDQKIPTNVILSPFPGWVRLSEPPTDLRACGPHNGLYVGIQRNQIVLATFKQERVAGKVCIENMLGASVGGALLHRIYRAIGVSDDRYNKVNIVSIAKEDDSMDKTQGETGQQFYLQSIFVPGYQEEFWKFAYREYYKKSYLTQFENADIKLINELVALLMSYYQSEIDMNKLMLQAARERLKELTSNRIKTLEQNYTALETNIAQYQTRLNYIKRLFPHEIDILSVDSHLRTEMQYHPERLAQELAAAKVAKLNYATVVNSKNKRVINQALLSNENLLNDFARLVAPRLLVGDFAVHSNNFGIVNNTNADGKATQHLVAINFSAACNNIIKYLNPFHEFTTRPSDYGTRADTDKNYYLEYANEIRSSLEMAKAFLEVGKIEKKQMKQMINDAISEQFYYDGVKRKENKFTLSIIKTFCNRIGMRHE